MFLSPHGCRDQGLISDGWKPCDQENCTCSCLDLKVEAKDIPSHLETSSKEEMQDDKAERVTTLKTSSDTLMESKRQERKSSLSKSKL